jgi:carboxyl-terminal processing protease
MKKYFLSFVLFCFLAGFAWPQQQALSYFLFLLNQIYSKTLFKIDQKIWLQHSLRILFPYRKFPPTSLNQYTQILEEYLKELPQPQRNLFLTDAIQSLLASLPDPYADFLSPKEIEEEKKEHHGNTFIGFGLELAQHENGVVVAGILPQSPAKKAGVIPGDKILEINGRKIQTLKDAFGKLNPPDVFLVLQRGKKNFKKKIHAGWIHLVPFDAKFYEHIGYVHMEVILPDSAKKFADTMNTFQSKGIHLLVLDLRDCLGGNVNSAAKISGYFLHPQDLIYIQESRNFHQAFRNMAQKHFNVPLVILTDGATASAGELLTGALKDHHAAWVYGEKTLGKGFMETTWLLPGGWELRLTTAQYLLPNGKAVQGRGIEPDVTCQTFPVFQCQTGKFASQIELLLHQIGEQ